MPSAHVQSEFFRIILKLRDSSDVPEIRLYPIQWLSKWLSEQTREIFPLAP
jgi:hypothetical protein